MYSHTHTPHIHIHIHTPHTHTHTHTHHTYTHTYTHHAYTYTHIHTCVHIHTYTHTHTHTHTHTTHMHAHTHTTHLTHIPTHCSTVFVNADQKTGFGTPWEVQFISNFTVLFKGGNVEGYSALFSYVPKLQLGTLEVYGLCVQEMVQHVDVIGTCT